MNNDYINHRYCKECGSTCYDKHWGLSHNEGCPANIDGIEINLEIPKKLKATWSQECANDLESFYGNKMEKTNG